MNNKFYFLVALTALTQLFSCSNNFKGRQPSSSESMKEIEKTESTAFYLENKYLYTYKLSQFIQVANNPSINISQKTVSLNKSLAEAKASLDEQCGFFENMYTGCGTVVGAVQEFLGSLQTEVYKGDFKKAALRANNAILLMNK